IASSGNYIGGAIWPPVVQHFMMSDGWRPTHIGIGLVTIAITLPLLVVLRRRAPVPIAGARPLLAGDNHLGLSPNALTLLLCIAGFACCMAMAMPQVHIVAYCADLGFGVARGAEMLALMLGFGIVSRVGAGFVADRIGAVATLLIGSLLQGLALGLY